MKILESIQNRFILNRISPSDSINPFVKFRSKTILLLDLILVISVALAAAKFISINVSNDLRNSLHATACLTVASFGSYSMMVAFVLRRKLSDIFLAFQNFHDKYKNIDTDQVMQKANKRSANVGNVGDYFMGFTLVTFLILLIVSLIYSYFRYDYANADVLFRLFRLTLPWDQNCLSGWIAEGVYSLIFVAIVLPFAVPFLLLFVSFLFFHEAFNQIYRSQFKSIDSIRCRSATFGSYKLTKLLIDTVLFHIAAKEVFQKTIDAYSTFILVSFINMMVITALSLLESDLAIRHVDLDFLVVIISFIYGLAQLYGFCFVGKHSTDCYLDYGDCLYESNWMALPIELQKSFRFMIAHAQRPLHYHGYLITILDLELFTKIIKTIVSYYLMFRTLTE